MTRRFYANRLDLSGDGVELDGVLARRLAKVLRARAGDEFILFDGAGNDVRVRVERANERVISVSVVERTESPPEPRVRVHLYQAIVKGERFEWLLEKGTELGVARFVPLVTARSVVKTGGEGNRLDRWRRIAVEAAEQSERGAVPDVGAPQTFDEALASAPGVLLLPFERAGEEEPNIHTALTREIDAVFALGEVSIFIGPEGGFEMVEVERAQAAEAIVVTLGARVLRSETAGLVAATLVLQSSGELG